MVFVQGIVYKRIAPGQTLTIFGGFFDGGCSVYFGSTKADVVDYAEDRIECVAPIAIGSYKVTIHDGDGDVVDAGNVEVLALADTPKRNAPKVYGDEDFYEYVVSLLPRGNAFAMWSGSNFRKLLSCLAFAFEYVWFTIRSMADAIDPMHTSNIDDWEDELHLPMVGNADKSEAKRRAEIYRVECTDGGCSKGYIKRLLALMDIKADVYEYTSDPDKFADYEFGEDDPRYYFKVSFHLSEDDFVTFNAGESAAGDYLLEFSQYLQEAVFDEIKPSHTKVIYGYDDSVIKGYILGDDGTTRMVDDDGEAITFTETA